MRISHTEHEINRRQLLQLAILVSSTMAVAADAQGANTAKVRTLLGRPTKNSITISLITDRKISGYIEYGISKTKLSQKTSLQSVLPGTPALFDLKGLKSDSTIYYRVNYAMPNVKAFTTGTRYSFVTQRKSSTPFTFTLHGDTHPERKGKMFNEELYKNTLTNVLSQKPDFHLLMGDDFSIDPLIAKGQANQANVENVYATHREWLEIIGNSTPLFLVNGNHEQAAGYLLDGTLTNPAVLAGNARNKFFPLPSPDGFYTGDEEQVDGIGYLRDYYAWEWGNALFVVLDPYWHSKKPVDNVAGDLVADDAGSTKNQKKNATGGGNSKTANLWEVGIGDEQYNWLKKTLESSKAKFKFVFAHHVMGTGRGGIEVSENYEWGGKDPKGQTTFAEQRPNWELPIHDLMAKNGVSIFFQGHDHIFVTQERDGVIYQSMPNPADDTFSYFNDSAYKSGFKAPNSGHVRVSVAAEKVKVEYFLSARPQDVGRKNKEIAHAYEISAK